MLVIRFSRTGRTNQAAYRLVVAEHSAPIQGKFVEILGSYNPGDNKKFEYSEDRVKYWMSVGAKPSDSVAALFKTNGMSGMDEFIAPRDKKKRKKNGGDEEVAAPVAASVVAPAAPAEETPAPETPAAEEAPAEEPAAEEAPAAEETPAE